MINLEDFNVAGDDSIFELLNRVFAWNDKNILKLDPVSGGITNSLFRCNNTTTNETVLIRLYGKSTDSIIDRKRELVAHEMLFDLDLASKLYAKFNNGIIYGFIQGSPLSFQDLPNWSGPIAKHLFTIHSKLDIAVFKSKLDNQTLCQIWPILDSWINQLNNIQLKQELIWLQDKLSNTSKTVACHSDLLAGNIITSKNGNVSFIDYEYLMIAPRAFDIANHLMEWQGFDCESFRIPHPTSETVKDWCKDYLSRSDDPNDDISKLIEEVKLHYGLPGFFWGIWSQIQSRISELDFDYESYSQKRLNEYWKWKEAL